MLEDCMKTPTKQLKYSVPESEQPKYLHPEDKAKIRKYNLIEKGLIGLAVIGVASALYGASAPIFSRPEMPKIAQTHQNNKENLMTLQYKRKNIETLTLNLEPPYQTKEIKDAKEFFDRTYKQSTQKLDNAIESVENKILKIKDDDEFKQHQQNKIAREKRENYLTWGGFLTFTIGLIGHLYPLRKRRDLEMKLKN